MPADEFAERLDIALPDDRSYDTIGGGVMAGVGMLPQVGEAFEAEGYRFEVLDLDGRRIDKILVARIDGKTDARTT